MIRWERLCFNIAKKKTKTRCIAYQHTPLNHNNVSAFYKIKTISTRFDLVF